jgi:acetoin utilization deacetylase AcuC-like enzyme
MKTAIVWDEAYADHDTGGHPEGVARIATIVAHLEQSSLWPQIDVVKPTPATEADVLRVHTPAHVEMIRHAGAGGGHWIDADTFVSPQSFAIALLAAGGVLSAITRWDEGEVPFALVRPPGHHATPDRAMGFCLFNNIAIAAASLLERGYERIAIIDWDVHHGNGTQAIFYDDPRVLFVSLHQWPHWPGSGWFDECGDGDGEGFTVNVPLPGGSVDGDYAFAFANVVEPIVRQFTPQAILVSAGQDPHTDDPLGGMDVTEDGFAHMALRALALAQELCGSRLALALEGGYDRRASAASVAAILAALAEERARPVGKPQQHAMAAVWRAVEAQKAFWEL